IPEISLIREMSKDFNVSVEDILDGEDNSNPNSYKKRPIKFILLLLALLAIIGMNVYLILNKDNFNFKTITTTCKEFKVKGTIAYDSTKSSINISKIEYCGGDDKTNYDKIECELYEQHGDTKTLISKCNKVGSNEKLEDYLADVEIRVDDYKQKCKYYSDDELYLEIIASKDNKNTVYKVDLLLGTNCPKE
ncbi:MAG: hypothetical protein J6X02_04650, partial [Bacilli bacterium]|nr:hypothetical protein [Bacilli bacterium]